MVTTATGKKQKHLNLILIFLCVLILILTLLLLQLFYTILKNNEIYKGVYIDGINAEGLSPKELRDTLENKYRFEMNNIRITLMTDNYKERYSLEDLGISIDIDTSINNGFSVGREGNIFKRVGEIINVYFNDKNIEPVLVFNDEKIKNVIDSFYDNIFIPVKEPKITFNEDYVLINSGQHGENIDKENLFSEITDSAKELKTQKINISPIKTPQSKIQVEDLLNKICNDPIDASVRVTDNVLTIIPHKPGRVVDRILAEEVCEDLNKGDNIEKSLPITFIEPDLTEDQLKENMFKDVLGTGKTYFSTADQYNIDRNENLKLSLDCINGIILAPGDVFSFDRTLGERTVEKGYKSAKTFSGGEIIESIGGGICQISSTLYNAVLYSNLEVVERHNHSFIVSYLPAGYDAAVAFRQIDFKFKNSTKWPVKIQGTTTSANEVVISIIGTIENPGKEVSLSTEIVGTTEYKTVYTDDPNLLEGKTTVKQAGINGCVVNTYKAIKQNGEEIKKYKITTSVYIPLNMEVIRGTKKLDHTIVDEMTEYIDKPDDIIDSYDKMDTADENYKEDIDNEADSDNETKDDNKADMDNKGDISDEAGSKDIVDKDNDAENNDIGRDNANDTDNQTNINE